MRSIVLVMLVLAAHAARAAPDAAPTGMTMTCGRDVRAGSLDALDLDASQIADATTSLDTPQLAGPTALDDTMASLDASEIADTTPALGVRQLDDTMASLNASEIADTTPALDARQLDDTMASLDASEIADTRPALDTPQLAGSTAPDAPQLDDTMASLDARQLDDTMASLDAPHLVDTTAALDAPLTGTAAQSGSSLGAPPLTDSPPSEAPRAKIEPPQPSTEAIARAQASRDWRIARIAVLPVVGGAASLGSLYGLSLLFSAGCSGSIGGGDYVGPCGLVMIGTIFSAYIMLVPAAVSAIGLLMKGRGQYGITVLGALSGVTLSLATAFFGFPFFAFPMLVSVVLAPLGAVIAYEISSMSQENNVLERIQPMVMPLREGIAAGVRVALW